MRSILLDMASGIGPLQYFAVVVGLVAGLWLLVRSVRERATARQDKASADSQAAYAAAEAKKASAGGGAAGGGNTAASQHDSSGFFKVFVPPDGEPSTSQSEK